MNLPPAHEGLPVAALLCWGAGLALSSLPRGGRAVRLAAHGFILAGILAMAALLARLWWALDRPPLRTLGETRLWYGMFLPLTGYAVCGRRGHRWILYFATALAALFLGVNLLHPENFDRDLMPALQSPWFVPHVVVYLLAYAVLAVSAIIATRGLLSRRAGGDGMEELRLADPLVRTGFGFLTLGLLFGALWGKEAWGHYWTWDPKEIWAFLTWMGYLAALHHRHYRPARTRAALWMLSLAFVVLLVCWFGVNYLPAAAGSVHVYTR